MSHEIRTPLNAVIGILELLENDNLDSEQKELMHIAHDSANSLLKVISDILDFSKIESGMLDVASTPFEFADLLGDIGHSFILQAEEKGIELLCPGNIVLSCPLMGDPVRLRQILINLVGNSIKFTSHGSISVFVR
jgi:signal transduction histidine kinase